MTCFVANKSNIIMLLRYALTVTEYLFLARLEIILCVYERIYFTSKSTVLMCCDLP